MNKQLRLIGKLMQQLQEAGDQDECSMKHVIHGLCLLHVGQDPSNQSLYVDYSDSGIVDYEVSLESVFLKEVWSEIKERVDGLSKKDKENFYLLSHPYGNIEDSYQYSDYDNRFVKTNLQLLEALMEAHYLEEAPNYSKLPFNDNWRILDLSMGVDDSTMMYFTDDHTEREQTTTLQVEFKSTNHSGIAFCCIEEYISEVEILSDIVISKEVDKEYIAGDTIEHKPFATISYRVLGRLGFSHDKLTFNGDDEPIYVNTLCGVLSH